MPSFIILFLGISLVSYLVQLNLKKKFEKYSQVPVALSGKEVAEKMLRDNGIFDVRVVSTSGYLTDHYHPVEKTVNLSEDVYNGRSVAAAAVAAHECGHAVQHATAYSFLQMRSALVPVVSFASNYVSWVLMAGVLLIGVFPHLLLIGILLFAVTTLFSLVTLPVEVDASMRAVAWLERAGITYGETHSQAKSALRSAAYTYVSSALTSLATLFYYISIFSGRSDD